MPISECYFVQAVLQHTLAHAEPLQWEAREPEGFRAVTNGVALELDSVATRSGPRLYLTLESNGQKAFIEEPVNIGVFEEHYRSEGQRELAGLLRELFCAASEQCAERERERQVGQSREALFRLALFGVSTDTSASRAFQPKPA